MNFSELEKHKYYKNFRLELPKEMLRKLPVKQISIEDLFELFKNADYNPICYYNKQIVPKEHEVGHDVNFRYIVKKGDKK